MLILFFLLAGLSLTRASFPVSAPASASASETCSASGAPLSSSGGLNCGDWQFSIRHDKDTSDTIPASFFDAKELQHGAFLLPSTKITYIGVYYSLFLGANNYLDDDAALKEISHFIPKGAIDSMKKTAYTQPFLSHTFLVLGTVDGKYHSMEKLCDYIDFRSSDSLQNLTESVLAIDGHSVRRLNVRFDEGIGWQTPKDKNLSLQNLRPLLLEELENEYSLLFSNCKHFTRRLRIRLVHDMSVTEYFVQQD